MDEWMDGRVNKDGVGGLCKLWLPIPTLYSFFILFSPLLEPIPFIFF